MAFDLLQLGRMLLLQLGNPSLKLRLGSFTLGRNGALDVFAVNASQLLQSAPEIAVLATGKGEWAGDDESSQRTAVASYAPDEWHAALGRVRGQLEVSGERYDRVTPLRPRR
jgi:hypothetical protein